MLRKALWAGLALSVIGFASIAAAQGTVDERTVMTFGQPVEIAGHVLPAGTYTFMLADSFSDRNWWRSATLTGRSSSPSWSAIPDYRLRPTGQTVVKFPRERRAAPRRRSARGSIPATITGRNSCIRSGGR